MLSKSGFNLQYKFDHDVISWLNTIYPNKHWVLADGMTFLIKGDPFDETTWSNCTLRKTPLDGFSFPADIFFDPIEFDDGGPLTRTLIQDFCLHLSEVLFPAATDFYLHSLYGTIELVGSLSHVETMSTLRKVGTRWTYMGVAL